MKWGPKKLVGAATEVFSPSPTQAPRYFRFLFFCLVGGWGISEPHPPPPPQLHCLAGVE